MRGGGSVGSSEIHGVRGDSPSICIRFGEGDRSLFIGRSGRGMAGGGSGDVTREKIRGSGDEIHGEHGRDWTDTHILSSALNDRKLGYAIFL